MIRAVLYDFDGTLADSFGAITASTNHVRQLHGFPILTEETVREYVGLGLPNLMQTLVPGVDIEQAVQEYRAHHGSVLQTGTKLLPGVLHTLQTLHQRGIPQAVCSNKRVEFTKQLVREMDLSQYFCEVIGPEDVGHPKPHPAMLLEAVNRLKISVSEAVYIGDMSIDVETAKAAKMQVWIVPDGAKGQYSAEAAGPDRMLKTFTEILDLV
jgi:phosphoglycolate phosphatase